MICGGLSSFERGLKGKQQVPEYLFESLPAKVGGSPLLQQGELDFSPAEKRFLILGMG
jgi:hypothetical protein